MTGGPTSHRVKVDGVAEGPRRRAGWACFRSAEARCGWWHAGAGQRRARADRSRSSRPLRIEDVAATEGAGAHRWPRAAAAAAQLPRLGEHQHRRGPSGRTSRSGLQRHGLAARGERLRVGAAAGVAQPSAFWSAAPRSAFTRIPGKSLSGRPRRIPRPPAGSGSRWEFCTFSRKARWGRHALGITDFVTTVPSARPPPRHPLPADLGLGFRGNQTKVVVRAAGLWPERRGAALGSC